MLTRNDNRKSKKRKRQKYVNTTLSSDSFNFLIKNTRFDAEEILEWFR